jgi:hypothetical protein
VATNIITMLGGVLIIFTGAILAGAGIVLGVQAAVPTVPPWVFFFGFGILALIGGLIMVYIGKERTVKTVERKLTLKDIVEKHPLGMVSITVAAGFLLGAWAKRARHSKKVVAQAEDQLHAFAEANLNETAAKEHPWRNKIQALVVSSALQALAVGMQKVAIPYLEKMLAAWQRGKEDTRTQHNGATESTEEHERFSRYNGTRS